jgi:hypothetical protein
MKKEDKKGDNQTCITDPTPPCEQCGSEKDVSYCIEPYAEDVNGTIHWMWICKECYHNNVQDI